MVPMLDPMVPEATLLVAISPAFAGVAIAVITGAATAIAGTLRELRRGDARRPNATPAPIARPDTALRAA